MTIVRGWVGLNVGGRWDWIEVAKTIIKMPFGVAVGQETFSISPNTSLTGIEVNFRPIQSIWCPQ